MVRALKRMRLDNKYFEAYGDLNVHTIMLRDKPRIEAYWSAFKANEDDFRDKIVLDVGTGSGLLAMMAVKLGAKKVIAVEASEKIAKVAERLIKENSMEDRVTIHCCKVEALDLGELKVDTLVSEWMGFYLLHESMLDSVLFARDKFLKPDGRIYPEKANIWLAPLGLENVLEEQMYFHDICGLDFSSTFPPPFLESPDVTRGIEPRNIIGEPRAISKIDIKTITAQDLVCIKAQPTFSITRDAVFAGVGIWFDCYFPTPNADTSPIKLDTAPAAPITHWKQTIIYFGQYPKIAQGESVDVIIQMNQDKEEHRKYVVEIELA